MKTFDSCDLIRALYSHNVDFIIIGGIAGLAHGISRPTFDIDVMYCRSPENINRIAKALAPLKPYLRDVPEGLPFVFDAETISKGLNFTLTTTVGPIDFLGTAPGAPDFETLLPDTSVLELCECEVRVVSLDKLIDMKQAAGRPKDFEVVALLKKLRDA